jgi:uncharacterized protein GlcG (DUF336 family)
MARLEETYMQNKDLEALVTKVVKEALGAEEKEPVVEMSLEYFNKMAEYAKEKANEMGVPIVFAAVDAGGNLITLQRMENALLASIKISWDKAYTSCILKAPTCALADLTVPGAPLYGLQDLCDGRIVVFGGGYPIMDGGNVLAAIGVSGGTAEEDMAIATYALEKMQGGEA